MEARSLPRTYLEIVWLGEFRLQSLVPADTHETTFKRHGWRAVLAACIQPIRRDLRENRVRHHGE
jgi:hypothetical protein